MDDFDNEIKIEFINEALMNLEEAEGSFMELETAADTVPLLNKIFRVAHNLKGGSRAVGFGQVAEFTHELENLVLKIQKGEVPLSPPIITTLLRSNDRLVEMLTGLKVNLNATFEYQDILSDIKAWLEGKVPDAAAPAAESKVETSALVLVDVSIAEELPVVPGANQFFAAEEIVEPEPIRAPVPIKADVPNQSPAAAAPSGGKGDDEVIRVNLSRIDLLNDYVGELIVLQSVVQQQSLSGSPAKLHVAVQQMVKLSKDIQSLSMSLRMLPVKPLIQKLQRVVRDTARALGKEVNLEVRGEQMEIDKSVLDRLSDPLIHILRNAVDHGLETTSDRVEAGKSKAGTVTLSFSNEGNHLVVEVSDDGKGINGEVLRKKAIEKKIVAEGQVMSEKQLLNLIFHPGFSTKTETSEISGRGVGMDVVKTNVEHVGGSIDISTVVSKGSNFKLQIPLSLAVIEGLVVMSESNRYVVPLSLVMEAVNLKSHTVHPNKLGVGACFELRGAIVPLFGIEEALGNKKMKAKVDGTALIVKVDDRPIGIVVQDILRAQQIVIKPLGNGIVVQKGWVGSCVLGDGMPTLILNPVDLLHGKIKFSYGETKREVAS